MSANRASEVKASERLPLWSEALFEELFPEQEEPGTPVLLACDDETVHVVAERLGIDTPDPSTEFGRDVAVAFGVGKIAGWKSVVAGDGELGPRPRPLPLFFPVLCLWVLAASRMAPYENHTTGEYHGQLCRLVGVSGDDSLPCFNFIGPRFRDFADWLAEDMEGRYGHLIVPESPRPEYVGYAVAQTVFRLRDRQVLSTFFAERLRGSLDGFDPLRRLQRWSGRGALTKHALQLLENPAMEDRVRAAIRAAFQSWDGSELVEAAGGRVGRVWPARIRLLAYPPRLQFGAAHPKPIELTIDGEEQTLAPGRELELPWSMLDHAAAAPVVLGDPHSAGGGVRLPALGETLLFENSEEGLLRVEQPAAEAVWVLSRDGFLQERFARLRFNDGGSLPARWELFCEVPVAELPGVERAAVERPQQTPLQLEGGLPLGRRLYLSGLPPYLAAGDLETDEQLPVTVNGEHHRFIASGERVALPAEPGWYELEVGDGDYRTSYEVVTVGTPSELRLCHHLSDEHALRRGARLARDDGLAVCGASVHPPV